MKKGTELTEENSCLNKAKMNEYIFVMLERDPAFPATVRFWADKRIALGKNKPTDIQICEALSLAQTVEEIQFNSK